jgi:hypothetical protein
VITAQDLGRVSSGDDCGLVIVSPLKQSSSADLLKASASYCEMPIKLLSLVMRQYSIKIARSDAETTRPVSFCSKAFKGEDLKTSALANSKGGPTLDGQHLCEGVRVLQIWQCCRKRRYSFKCRKPPKLKTTKCGKHLTAQQKPLSTLVASENTQFSYSIVSPVSSVIWLSQSQLCYRST